jgi:hypothetical protein
MRPLRVLFLANDGSSVGHVMRCAAVARALGRTAEERRVPLRCLLVTTSEARRVLDGMGALVVSLPSPGRATGLGWDEADRRRVVQGALEGLVDSFAPDVLVADTFPAGAQLEAASVLHRIPRRLLIRRRIRAERARDPVATTGLELYQRILVPADPDADAAAVGTAVPPITFVDGPPVMDPEAARRALGLRAGPWALITCGGAGDRDNTVSLDDIAQQVREHGVFRPVIGPGVFPPKNRVPAIDRELTPRLECVPLQPYLNAFDLVIGAAGYNLAHEVAISARPMILFGLSRSYDDQMDRVRRFAEAGLAVGWDGRQGIGEALDRAQNFRPPGLAGGGAQVVARHILDLAGEAA